MSMSTFSYTNKGDTEKVLVYAPPLGVSLCTERVPPGETWNQGAMETFYAVFDTMDEANAYCDSFFHGNRKASEDARKQDA